MTRRDGSPMDNGRSVASGEGGFTLIEVLVAVSIFAVGLLGVAQMQVVSMRTNAHARQVTEASTLLTSWSDELKMLEFTKVTLDDYLSDANGDGALGLNNEGADADWSRPAFSGGTQFTLSWNVDASNDSYRIVRLIARWGRDENPRRLSLDVVIPRKQG